MDKALEGIRVLDFSRYKAGPTCGQFLADMGAEVIRIEKPGGDDDRRLGPFAPDGQSMYLAFTCRNKKGITLDLAKQKGREIIKKLVMQSDVVIENFGPAGNRKLGLDYNSLRKIKSDIIVVAISGFGQYGPYANRLCFDAIAQAMSGLMQVTGFPDDDRPVRLGVSFVDMASGVYAALGALLALYYRDKTGEGQLVDMSLLDTAVSFTESIFGEFKVARRIRPRVGNANVLASPYNAFKAKDGWVFITTVTQRQWESLCKVTGREELASDPRFQTMEGRCQLESIQFFSEWLGKWVADKTVSELVNQLNKAGIPCGPVNTIPEVFSDPHIHAREMIVELDHPGIGEVPLIGIPIKLSQTPGEIRTPAPKIGEHNEEIYCGLLNLSSDKLLQLKQEGVI